MRKKKKDFSDKILPDSSFTFILHSFPKKSLPFIKLSRFDRPIGIWLLMWPSWWGLSVSLELENELGSIYLYFLFFLGAIIMRGAGCTFNDLVDRKLDAKVERTSRRPLPLKQVSVSQAISWLIIQSLIGFIILIQFEKLTIVYGILSLGLVAVYPFMKRITWWPQFFLGLAFNYGIILASVEINNYVSIVCLLLYLSGIFWTLGYDTIYALIDIHDDIKADIKSTAIYLGKNKIKQFLLIFYSLSLILIFISAIIIKVKWFFWIIFIFSVLQILWQIITLENENKKDCLKKFKSNNLFGLLIFIGFLIGN